MTMNSFQSDVFVSVRPFVSACSASCRKLAVKLAKLKVSLLAEFNLKVRHNERMLQLALNEAEALADETGFHSLVFPTLAREKLESVAAWDRHQRKVREVPFACLAA